MNKETIHYEDIIILVSPKGIRHTRKVEEGIEFHSKDGAILGEDILQAGYGNEVRSKKGIYYLIQRPSLVDILYSLKRQTQIIYPKDIAYICLRLGVGNGRRIIEAGSGSGGLTVAMSYITGTHGHIYTYEAREEFYNLCKRNLEWASLGHNVTQYHRNIEEGFFEKDVDGVFLDLRNPWDYLTIASNALIPGGIIAFLLPTVNQVSTLLEHMEGNTFVDIEIEELFIRKWKAIPDRLRPFDRMVAHTSFLVFAKQHKNYSMWAKNKPQGTRERKQKLAQEERIRSNNTSQDKTID
ncbi:MAG: tRNA (adenine-N1)-methyltransferase [Desulfovibrionaceae bacterium]